MEPSNSDCFAVDFYECTETSFLHVYTLTTACTHIVLTISKLSYYVPLYMTTM